MADNRNQVPLYDEPKVQNGAPNSIAGADPEKKIISDDETHRETTNGESDRYVIVEDDCYDELGFSFPNWKKWTILSVVFLVQVSMNFNTSLYSNAIGGISEEFHVSKQAARLGAAIFLITYAFGCELWAPWSEVSPRPVATNAGSR
jgi:hypothetical protein